MCFVVNHDQFFVTAFCEHAFSHSYANFCCIVRSVNPLLILSSVSTIMAPFTKAQLKRKCVADLRGLCVKEKVPFDGRKEDLLAELIKVYGLDTQNVEDAEGQKLWELENATIDQLKEMLKLKDNTVALLKGKGYTCYDDILKLGESKIFPANLDFLPKGSRDQTTIEAYIVDWIAEEADNKPES